MSILRLYSDQKQCRRLCWLGTGETIEPGKTFLLIDPVVFGQGSLAPLLRQHTSPIQMNEGAAFFHAEPMLV